MQPISKPWRESYRTKRLISRTRIKRRTRCSPLANIVDQLLEPRAATVEPLKTDELRALADLGDVGEVNDRVLIRSAADEIDRLRRELCEPQAMSRAIEVRMMMGRT
jgi:hypothetical protein